MIARIDAWIQKRFDSAVHEFMRATGASKRTIRRNGWGLVLFCALGSLALGSAWWFGTAATIGSAFNLLWDDSADREAEGGASRSRADAYNKAWKWSFAAAALTLWVVVFDGFTVRRMLDLVLDLSLLFQGYLSGTSPQAPKKQREGTPLAQLARAP